VNSPAFSKLSGVAACFLLLALPGLSAVTASAASPAGAITFVVATPDGGASVEGWVCGGDAAAPPVVRISVGALRSSGQAVAEGAAHRPAPGGAQCNPGGQAQGFTIAVPRPALFRYGGLAVFATTLPAGVPLADAGQFLPEYRVVGDTPRSCAIGDMATMTACFARPNDFDRFVFTADITCGGASECCVGGHAPMNLVNVHSKRIEGGGHVLHRSGGQRDCPALAVQQSQDIVLDRLTIDDDTRSPPCELNAKPCESTINVQSARNVRLTGVVVYAGKGYVVRAWDTDGFAFIRSVVSDAGIVGVYVGHFKYGPSRNVVVADSVIARSRTNGLAVQGAISAGPEVPVLVMDNVFSGNHWHGLWPVPGVPGGITTGGQVLVADGHNVRLTGNIIANGACINCKPPQHVAAIELGDEAALPAGVFGLTIDHNAFLGSAGPGTISQNRGTAVMGAVLADNRMNGSTVLDSITGPVTRAHNVMSAELPATPHPDLALAPNPGAPSAPVVWCAHLDTPARGRIVSAPECKSPDVVIALLGYPRG
jgi:hypothetical protein